MRLLARVSMETKILDNVYTYCYNECRGKL